MLEPEVASVHVVRDLASLRDVLELVRIHVNVLCGLTEVQHLPEVHARLLLHACTMRGTTSASAVEEETALSRSSWNR